MDTLFTAGPRLTSPPEGDPSRQAIASLRGYAYQIYASALAWLELEDGEELYLEVAEDYAVAAEGALHAVQVKDTAGSGSVTINSEAVRNALDGFVDLVERNAERAITLRFLSTSSIGHERSVADRIAGEAGLLYWRKAAAGSDIAPLRALLERTALTERVRRYIHERDDELLRRDLLSRIHWDCGQPGIDVLREELKSSLVRYGARRLGLPAAEGVRLSAHVLQKLLETVVVVGRRRLIPGDLFALLSDATHVSISRQKLNTLLDAVANQFGQQRDSATVSISRQQLESESELILPTLLAKRTDVVERVRNALRLYGAAFITGGTGMGKTLVARLCARNAEGDWFIMDLRDASAVETVERLSLAINELAEVKPRGVILDDINELEEPTVRTMLARFLNALRRRDMLCLFTHYRAPTARTCAELNIDIAAHTVVPPLDEDEVGALIVAAGGDAQRWAGAIYMLGAFGHPQLILAAITGMRLRSWPIEELRHVQGLNLSTSDDVEVERRAARQRLIAVLPEMSRTLLYRLSLVIGRFDRKVALAVGDVVPNIQQSGEHLDQLIGPWIDQSTGSEFRISPLVSNAGDDMLVATEQVAIHRAIAEAMMEGESIHISRANAAFLHALLGQAEQPLVQTAYSVITASQESRERLAEWLTGLRYQRIDRPIFSANMAISRMLRLAQFLLKTETQTDDLIHECWDVLYAEAKEEPVVKVQEMFEALVLSKLLVERSIAGMIPNWLALLLRLEELIDGHAELLQLARNMEQPRENFPSGAVISFLFINQALGIRGVTELAVLFDQLDLLQPVQRARLFIEIERMPSDFSLFVNQAWLENHKHGGVDWLNAAEQYARMAVQAFAWGFRMLALRCYIARAVMFDEYAQDPTSALTALDEAELQLGSDIAIALARAKVLYRRKDHAAALPLLRQVASEVAIGDSIERAFMLREAGISAAELGEWKEAKEWFVSARQAAATATSLEMRPMAVGLRADAAVGAFKGGDVITALCELATTIEELDTIDPASSTKAAYCHRVVRHTVLWMFGEGTGSEVEVDGQPAAMVPGACSNPEPPEEIKKLPLGLLSIVWYLLAQIEIVTGVEAGIEAGLPSRLQHKTIPSLETALRKRKVEAAISRIDIDAIAIALGPWVDAHLYFLDHKIELLTQDFLQPAYGTIPTATYEQLRRPEAVFTVHETLLAFGVYAVCSGQHIDWNTVLEKVEQIHGSDYPGTEIIAALAGNNKKDAGAQYELASLIHALGQQPNLDPKALFTMGVRFVEAAARSNFKELLAGVVETWVKISWTKVVEAQRFQLRNPAHTVPIIEAAILTNDGLAGAAQVLLAAENGIDNRLSVPLRDFLRSLT